MQYPKFKDAEYTTTLEPVYKKPKQFFQFLLKYSFFLIYFIIAFFGIYFFFKFIDTEILENTYLNTISVSASLITVFSAVISVLSLLDSNCLKKYDEDLQLLENRYLDGRKISGWNFFRRYSKPNDNNNYCIYSAHYKLYDGNEPSNFIEIIVPALSIDFYDVPCLAEICRIKKFIPNYLKYLNNEQKNTSNIVKSIEQPSYFIPLPYNIISLHKRILQHKMLKHLMVFCSVCIICALLVTVIWIV